MPATNVNTVYLRKIVDTKCLGIVVKHLVEALKPHAHKFDTIAFTGLSGGIVGPLVAMQLDKHMLVVRKGEKSHSSCLVEGYLQSKNYVIVDDCVSTGATLRYIKNKIEQEFRNNYEGGNYPQCVGIALYNGYCDELQFELEEIFHYKDGFGINCRSKIEAEIENL